MMPYCDVINCGEVAARLNKGDDFDPLALCNKHQLYVTREVQKDIGATYRAATGIKNDAFTGMLGLPDIPDIQEGEIVPDKPKRKRVK